MRTTLGGRLPVRLLFVLIALVPSTARAEKRVGILLWNSQPRYEQCRDGIVEQLGKEGFKEPEVTYVVERAFGNTTTAVELARSFAQRHFDLVIAIGTSAAVAAAGEVKDVPVVFAMVFDPVGSKIALDLKSSGNNTTGASSETSMSKLLSTLQQLAPVKRVSVLFTPGERNSEAQLTGMEALQKEFQVTTTAFPLSSRAEVAATMSRVTQATDAVVLTGSSVIGDSVALIVILANKARIITATQSDDHMEKGVLLGITANPAAVGRLAGEKAAKVLRGVKPSSIPIESLKTFDVILNLKTAKAMGIEVPDTLRRAVTRVVE
jgi:putative ABC transport system substrate-binding protein